MEKIWKLEADGFNLEIARYADTVRIECSRETPGVSLRSTAVLTLQQSKQIEAVFRAANRAAAGEVKP
jgi:hypothetical protein